MPWVLPCVGIEKHALSLRCVTEENQAVSFLIVVPEMYASFIWCQNLFTSQQYLQTFKPFPSIHTAREIKFILKKLFYGSICDNKNLFATLVYFPVSE